MSKNIKKKKLKINFGKTLSKERMQQVAQFIGEHADYVGLGDWKIAITGGLYQDNGSFANVDVDIYEKLMTISLSEAFKELEEDRQANILFHELMHGRVSIRDELVNRYVEKIEYEEDEQLVNDVTRGFERLIGGKFKFNKIPVKRKKRVKKDELDKTKV